MKSLWHDNNNLYWEIAMHSSAVHSIVVVFDSKNNVAIIISIVGWSQIYRSLQMETIKREKKNLISHKSMFKIC